MTQQLKNNKNMNTGVPVSFQINVICMFVCLYAPAGVELLTHTAVLLLLVF